MHRGIGEVAEHGFQYSLPLAGFDSRMDANWQPGKTGDLKEVNMIGWIIMVILQGLVWGGFMLFVYTNQP